MKRFGSISHKVLGFSMFLFFFGGRGSHLCPAFCGTDRQKSGRVSGVHSMAIETGSPGKWEVAVVLTTVGILGQ